MLLLIEIRNDKLDAIAVSPSHDWQLNIHDTNLTWEIQGNGNE